MIQNRFMRFIFVGVLLSMLSSTANAVDESITYDPSSGGYIYRYRGYDIFEDGRTVDLGIIQGTFTPAKISPTVQSTFRIDKNWAIDYRYTLINDKSAKQAIDNFYFGGITSPLVGVLSRVPGLTKEQSALVAASRRNSVIKPAGWEGWFNLGGTVGMVQWMPNSGQKTGNIIPGTSLAGFGYASFDLPGIVQASIEGQGISSGFEDSNGGPAETSPLRVQSELIHDEDYKPYPVAAPVVVVPKLFDASVVVENIRAHVATWPNFKTGGYNGNVPPDKKIFLLDIAFAAQLDRYLAAAAEAFRRNQLEAGKEHLETIHEMLEKEHKPLDSDDEKLDEEKGDKDKRSTTARPNIDRLAARVLDFDLKYVLKRIEFDEDEHKKR